MFGAKSREIVSCVVVDVIFDKSIEGMNNVLKSFNKVTNNSIITNREYLEKCPKKSLIVRVPDSSEYIIVYPFFSSHFNLPVKPGEHVWCFFPEGFGKNNLGYWMTRRSTDEFIEDVNFTHNVRSSHKSYFEKKIDTKGENRLQKYYSSKGRDFEKYEEVLKDSFGNNSHIFESIARIKNKPGDLSLQGSNNSQLILTSGKEANTGTAILTTGRGKTSSTSPEKIINSSGLEENNKASTLSNEGVYNENEGNLDILNDKSILILSENPSFLNEFSEEEIFNESSYFFTKSDEARIEARNSILMSTRNVKVTADEIILGSGSQPYIRYDEFESLIKNIVSDINTLALQIAEINGTLYTFGVSGQAASQGPLVPLQALFGQIPAVLNPPGSGDSEKVYNKTINKRLNEIQDCKSEKIFGE